MAGLIIDTDVGFDDLLAILFLLSQPTIEIEAFTVVNGICDPEGGARALLKLQEMIGGLNIPVYVGATQPMSGSNAFPSQWRHQAHELYWGKPDRSPESVSAFDYLSGVLRKPGSVSILAIGPLTNLGMVLEQAEPVAQIARMAIMGGAIHAKGNIPGTRWSEGNMYVDPLAARKVFAANLHPVLVPLDASDHVPIDKGFLDEFFAIPASRRSPLWPFADQVLQQISRQFVDPPPPTRSQPYFAWDPLAGVSIADPGVLSDIGELDVVVELDGDNPGRTTSGRGAANARVAMAASAKTFRSQFMAAFTLDAKTGR
jgi:inosine-uridine nucleoside N-ribohydrolase